MKRKPQPLKPAALGASFTPAPSSLAHGLNISTVVSVQNHWREFYNPLRALNMQRAIALYDFARRGLNAELQNVYREMEGLFPTLIGLIERRTAPLLEMDWTCKAVAADRLPPGCTREQAEEQAAFLRQAYERIDNLYEAIEWLELGAFRGYAHLEKIYANPGTSDWTIEHLEPIEQWHWTRKSIYAEWEYVASATQTNSGVAINYDQFVIREMPWALDRIALLLWIRANLAEKDWDAFVELYGVPKWVVIMPPNVPKEKELEYKEAARAITQGAPGALPGGSEAVVSDPKTEGTIFKQRIDHIQEQLVLAGTGGMLSMLSKPTGIGKGATDEHADAFDEISEMESAEISELFNRQLDVPILDREFPGQPRLAFMALAAPEETDIGQVCAQVLQLSQAGYQVDPDQLSDKTGYTITVKPAPAPPTLPGGPPNPPDPAAPGKITNRAPGDVSADLVAATGEQYSAAVQRAFKPLADRLYAIQELDEPGLELAAMRKLQAELNDPKSALITSIMADPAGAQALASGMASGFFNGVAANISLHAVKNRAFGKIVNGGLGSGRHAGDSLGKWVDANGGGLSERDNIQRGNKALNRAISQKADVQKAMYRKEVGQIDFKYGTPGATDNDFKGGKGISHALAKHGEDSARQIPETIAKGKISDHPDDANKKIVEQGGHTVILARDNKKSAWVLTAFHPKT